MAYPRYSGPPPPPYESIDSLGKAPTTSKWNPKNWSKLTILGVVAAVIIVIVAVVVGAVLGTKANAYPDYSAINYTLVDTYSGTTFFDEFDYFTGYDPSSGFVHYVDESVATSTQYNLTYASSDSAVLRVDTTDTDASTGRYSVRITSKKQYNTGLFVFDVLNVPYGCSTWRRSCRPYPPSPMLISAQLLYGSLIHLTGQPMVRLM